MGVEQLEGVVLVTGYTVEFVEVVYTVEPNMALVLSEMMEDTDVETVDEEDIVEFEKVSMVA